MKQTRKSKVLYRDHRKFQQGHPPFSKQRRPLLSSKHLVAIAAIAGALLFPEKSIDFFQNKTTIQYGPILGDILMVENNPIALTTSPKTRATIAHAIVEEAIHLDKPEKPPPNITKFLLAKHVDQMESIVQEIQNENQKGIEANIHTTRKRLNAIETAEKYFATKKLPSLLPIAELARIELIRNTPQNNPKNTLHQEQNTPLDQDYTPNFP
jgi:hypothetical protein